MTAATAIVALSTAQQAAVAKLAYAVETADSLAVLCGAAGTGKSLVLEALARSPALRGRRVRHDRFPESRGLPVAGANAADVVLVDDAHLAEDGELARCVDAWRAAAPAAAVVLAGQGRLLTLLSRDARLASGVRMRVTVPPFSLAETRLLVAARAGAGGLPGDDQHVATTIHDIAGGIPARIVQMADLARVVAESKGGQPLTVDDIETIHRRLAINAA